MVDIDLGATLHAAIEGLTGATKQLHAANAKLLERLDTAPRDVLLQFSGSSSAAATAPFALNPLADNAGPQQGEVWILRMLRVGGVTPTTTAAGRCDVFQQAVNPTAAGLSLGLGTWIDQATSLPAVAPYSSRYVVLRWPDNLWLVISNGTNSQQYVANAQFEVYKDGGYPGEVNL